MDGLGWDWKSLQALTIRAPLCGANNIMLTMSTMCKIEVDDGK